MVGVGYHIHMDSERKCPKCQEGTVAIFAGSRTGWCLECRNQQKREKRLENIRRCVCGVIVTSYQKRCDECRKPKPILLWVACQRCGEQTWGPSNKKWCDSCKKIVVREQLKVSSAKQEAERTKKRKERGKFCRCGTRLGSLNAKNCRDCEKKRIARKNSENFHRRRALKKGSQVGEVSFAQVWEEAKNCCRQCGREVASGSGHIDHIVPLARGGAHAQENLQLLCAPCNLTKGARL